MKLSRGCPTVLSIKKDNKKIQLNGYGVARFWARSQKTGNVPTTKRLQSFHENWTDDSILCIIIFWYVLYCLASKILVAARSTNLSALLMYLVGVVMQVVIDNLQEIEYAAKNKWKEMAERRWEFLGFFIFLRLLQTVLL